MRHPLDRFMSLYKDKCQGRGDGVPAELYRIFDPWLLLEYIRKHPYDNVHWAPQSAVVGATRHISIERFGRDKGFHENASRDYEPAPVIDLDGLQEAVLQHYRNDRVIWWEASQ